MTRVFLVSTALAATILCASSEGRADLRVERAEGADACPDPKTFAARVHEGRRVAREPSRTITVFVRFERTSSGYASAVRTSDGMERALDDRAPGCDGLAEATLLAVRLAFDIPVQQEAASPPAPAQKESLPREVKEEPVAVVVPKNPHPPHVEILAGGMASTIGGAFAMGARATGVVTLGSKAAWTIGLTGFALAPQTQKIGDGPGEVEIGILGGGIDLCRRHRFEDIDPRGKLSLGLCARGEVGRLAGQARGFLINEEGVRPLVTGSLLLRAQRRFFGPIGLFGEVGGMVPIVRERFEIQRVGLVYDPLLVAASVVAGASVDFE